MKISKLFLAPLALLVLAGATAPKPADSAADRVRADVEFLASDLLEGRDTGSRGQEIAASYVSAQFRSIGLQPGGAGGSWYQRVPFRRAAHAKPSQASLAIGRATVALKPGEDFSALASLTEKERSIDAPLVFAGHGISAPQVGLDDYAGIDVRGKIVVALEGTPSGLPSEVSAHLDSAKVETAAGKGALGMILIAGTGQRPDYNRVARYERPVIDWTDPAGKTRNASSRLGLVAAIVRPVAEKLIRAAGRDPRKILNADKGKIAGFDLPVRLRFADSMAWEDFSSPQVIGLLPGADPALRGQHVLLTAHLDHLGIKPDAKPGEDAIYNGALDNAAGVATMIEAAREFVESGKPPRRSVLFIAITGEEKGLRGSDYFAAHPTVPIADIAGVVDLDMPMLLYPFADVIAFGGEHSTIAATIAEAARDMGVKVSPDPMPNEAIFVRSDHYRFVTRGVPAILLMTGYANGGEAKWNQFMAQNYHKPSDDLSQGILWDQGARYAELNYRIARALADADRRPLWYQGDYFGDIFAPGQPRATH